MAFKNLTGADFPAVYHLNCTHTVVDIFQIHSPGGATLTTRSASMIS